MPSSVKNYFVKVKKHLHKGKKDLKWCLDRWRSKQYEARCPPTEDAGASLALATVVNDAFVTYLAVLMHSCLRHNPGFSCPWIIFWNRSYSPLSDESRALLSSIYSPIEFIEVDAGRYSRFLSKTPKRLLAALFTLETFSVRGHERVWFLDADMVCLGSLDRLWTETHAFVACRSGNDYREKSRIHDLYVWDGGFNTGVFMLGKQYLRDDVYQALFDVNCPDYGVADQDIMNAFFRGKPAYLLPQKYNYHAGFFWDTYGAHDDVRLLHYAGKKPLEEPDAPRMKPWFVAAELAVKDFPALAGLINTQRKVE